MSKLTLLKHFETSIRSLKSYVESIRESLWPFIYKKNTGINGVVAKSNQYIDYTGFVKVQSNVTSYVYLNLAITTNNIGIVKNYFIGSVILQWRDYVVNAMTSYNNFLFFHCPHITCIEESNSNIMYCIGEDSSYEYENITLHEIITNTFLKIRTRFIDNNSNLYINCNKDNLTADSTYKSQAYSLTSTLVKRMAGEWVVAESINSSNLYPYNQAIYRHLTSPNYSASQKATVLTDTLIANFKHKNVIPRTIIDGYNKDYLSTITLTVHG